MASTGHAIPCKLTAFSTSVPDALPYGDPGSGQAALPGKSRRLLASKPSFSETHSSTVAAGTNILRQFLTQSVLRSSILAGLPLDL